MGFYAIFEQLCKENNRSLSQVRADLKISQSTMASWKSRGLTPKYPTLQKLAEYFNVSVEYLLNGEEKAPTDNDERKDDFGFNDFTYAMHNETKDLPQEKKDMLLEMARFLKRDMEKDKNK